RATHPDGFAAQRGSIANLDCGIKAIHVEMYDGARLLFIAHTEISHNTRSRPSGVFSLRSQISGFANRASVEILNRKFFLKWTLPLLLKPTMNRTGTMLLMSITS